MNIPITEINSLIKTKEQLHQILNEIYFLPNLTSNAIDLAFLQKLISSNDQVLRIFRKDMKNLAILTTRKSFNGEELLAKLDSFLIRARLPPTGFTLGSHPNISWILATLLHLDPEDSCQVFGKFVSLDSTIHRNVDPEYFFFLIF
jgi:hypothetical protein